MVTAPVLVFLYDRTFVAGGFRKAWTARRTFYLGLSATWTGLAYLLATMGATRGGSAGFSHGVEWWPYVCSQCEAVVHYLRLGLWPSPLVFDYGQGLTASLRAIWPQALGLAALLGGTVYSLIRRNPFGFVSAAFFILISPSSSVVPIITQTWAEHRMYLPLACEITVVVLCFHAAVGRSTACVVLAAIAVGFSLLTFRRNCDYQTARAIWADTAAKRPNNPRARLGLGDALFEEGQLDAAVNQFCEALRLEPNLARAHASLGVGLLAQGNPKDALIQCRRAVELVPGNASMRANLGDILRKTGNFSEAIAQYEIAVQLSPDDAFAHAQLATALMQSGQIQEAIPHFETALRIDPDLTEARCNFATALLRTNRVEEAIVQYRCVLRSTPGDADVHFLLGSALAVVGRRTDAIEQYKIALRFEPKHADARRELERLQEVTNSTSASISK